MKWCDAKKALYNTYRAIQKSHFTEKHFESILLTFFSGNLHKSTVAGGFVTSSKDIPDGKLN